MMHFQNTTSILPALALALTAACSPASEEDKKPEQTRATVQTNDSETIIEIDTPASDTPEIINPAPKNIKNILAQYDPLTWAKELGLKPSTSSGEISILFPDEITDTSNPIPQNVKVDYSSVLKVALGLTKLSDHPWIKPAVIIFTPTQDIAGATSELKRAVKNVAIPNNIAIDAVTGVLDTDQGMIYHVSIDTEVFESVGRLSAVITHELWHIIGFQIVLCAQEAGYQVAFPSYEDDMIFTFQNGIKTAEATKQVLEEAKKLGTEDGAVFEKILQDLAQSMQRDQESLQRFLRLKSLEDKK